MSDNIINLKEQLMAIDPKVDALGVVSKPDLPPEILDVRMKLILRVCAISDDVKNRTVQAVELFIKKIMNGENDISTAWANANAVAMSGVNTTIDFSKIFPQPTTVPLPKCNAIGEVRDKDGRLK